MDRMIDEWRGDVERVFMDARSVPGSLVIFSPATAASGGSERYVQKERNYILITIEWVPRNLD